MGKKESEIINAERPICDICGDTFKDKRGLAGHMAGRHGVRSTAAGATITMRQTLETPSVPVETLPQALGAKPTPIEETIERDEVELIPMTVPGIFSYEITLPADAFTYYNMARGIGLEPADKDFDEWLWDCIRKRFETDYQLQILIAPLA